MAKLTKQVEENLKGQGYLYLKEVEGVIIGVMRYAFTIALVYDITVDGDYYHRFCYPYEHTEDCLLAFKVWEGKDDPTGRWVKNKGYERDRRNPLIPDEFEEKIKNLNK